MRVAPVRISKSASPGSGTIIVSASAASLGGEMGLGKTRQATPPAHPPHRAVPIA